MALITLEYEGFEGSEWLEASEGSDMQLHSRGRGHSLWCAIIHNTETVDSVNACMEL